MENAPQILVVDDKPEIAKVIKIHLSSLGWEVIYHSNPPEAISWMQEGHLPDLIISDVYMPHMNGHEFLLYLKKSTLFKDIPVIILSSMENSSNRIQMLEDGAVDFILKPFNPQELKIRVRNLLKSRV